MARHNHTPSIRKPSIPVSRRRRSANSPLLPFPIIVLLRSLIVILLLWYELGTFWWSTTSCTWDDSPSFSSSHHSIGDAESTVGKAPFHALILADPQLLDMRSYPGRNWLARWLGVKVTNAYARKAWRFVVRSKGGNGLGADGVVWLGDLLDGGVESVEPAEHASYVHRFNKMFPLPRQPSPSLTPTLSSPIPSILLPGNHDLGLHLPSTSLASYARERFTESFGPTSGEREWGGWSVVWVDSMALLEDEVGTEARGFVEAIGDRPNDLPRILLTHIPLFRPEGTACGKDREHSRDLYEGSGKNYQNELDKPTSDWLLRTLAPTLVYSGDDHDACVVEHAFPQSSKESTPPATRPTIRESTIKAFSMAMGIHRPGYHLLSLYPPIQGTAPAYTQTNCTLPDQLHIWVSIYLPLASILLLSLLIPKLFRAFIHSRSVRKSSTALSNGLPVHKHSRSLSKKLFAGSNTYPSAYASSQFDLTNSEILKSEEDSDDDADQNDDQQFPTFPFSSSSPAVGYHSPLDSEDLPTASHSPPRVRRVSRVWAWEEGANPLASPSLPLHSSSYRRRRSSFAPHPDDSLPFLYLLGPINRWAIRPLTRLLRTGWRKFWGKKVVGWVLSWVFARPVREAGREWWDVVCESTFSWIFAGRETWSRAAFGVHARSSSGVVGAADRKTTHRFHHLFSLFFHNLLSSEVTHLCEKTRPPSKRHPSHVTGSRGRGFTTRIQDGVGPDIIIAALAALPTIPRPHLPGFSSTPFHLFSQKRTNTSSKTGPFTPNQASSPTHFDGTESHSPFPRLRRPDSTSSLSSLSSLKSSDSEGDERSSDEVQRILLPSTSTIRNPSPADRRPRTNTSSFHVEVPHRHRVSLSSSASTAPTFSSNRKVSSPLLPKVLPTQSLMSVMAPSMGQVVSAGKKRVAQMDAQKSPKKRARAGLKDGAGEESVIDLTGDSTREAVDVFGVGTPVTFRWPKYYEAYPAVVIDAAVADILTPPHHPGRRPHDSVLVKALPTGAYWTFAPTSSLTRITDTDKPTPTTSGSTVWTKEDRKLFRAGVDLALSPEKLREWLKEPTALEMELLPSIFKPKKAEKALLHDMLPKGSRESGSPELFGDEESAIEWRKSTRQLGAKRVHFEDEL
ncbi:ethanolamine phosphate phosphodiesterase, partial [Phenoliferia sp. Uapishka_3]